MLELQHVTVQSQDRIIIEDLSFQLKKSQSLAIVGESGSGKSTLLKILLGLPLRDLWIAKGQYSWQGKEQLQHGAPHGPRIVGVRHGVEIDAVALHLDFADLDAVGVFHTRTVHPVAFCKFHDNTSF